jgi:Pyruvate/2-oxoacid:ferredoxin oxidoreductase delta subunit
MSRILKRVYKPKTKKFDLPSAASYKLVYNGGPLLTNPEVFVIFLGSAWKKNTPDTDFLQKFFPSILGSSLLDQLSEYNAGSYKFGHGKYTGSAFIAHTFKGKKIDDSEIQTLLKSWIAAKQVPAVDAQTLYFVFTPQNIKVTAGKDASCTVFCGYHDVVDNNKYYAVIPYPSCNGCLGNLTAQQSLSVTTSHELCEAMTDPNPGNGWYNQQKGESGDFCGSSFKTINGYTVQQEWSNKITGCL